MDTSNYFEDFFESISEYRKIVLLIFLVQNDKNLLKEIRFSKNDNNRLNLELKNTSKEQHEGYSDFVKKEEESILERFLNK